jgi:hypothetical protein
MPTPKFSYFIARPENTVSGDHPIWNKPLPSKRSDLKSLHGGGDKGVTTIGDYFIAARLFFEKSGLNLIADAFRRRFKKKITPAQLEHISIVLLKHGEFYHPSRIEACIQDKRMFFVLNAAISRTGRIHIRDEYRNLKKLNLEFPLTVLPQVYGCDQVEIPKNRTVVMFLGQWFENYDEFHISRDPSDHKKKIVIWDTKGGNDFLTAAQSLDLYTQAAWILTNYFNLETFEQINSWHHAAGDFIVSRDNNEIDLKLISVRRYASRFKPFDTGTNTGHDVELILQALLLFFLSLSVKMRLDRLDGVGEIVWADDIAVQGTLIGFLNALDLKPRIPSLPDTVLQSFFHYLAMCSKSDLLDITATILSTFPADSPEIDVIRLHLGRHIDALHQCIHQL